MSNAAYHNKCNNFLSNVAHHNKFNNFLSDVTHHNFSLPFLLLSSFFNHKKKEYVRDFIWRRTQEGATVAVMVARGLMDLPIRGMNTFHGARWEDGHKTSQFLRSAMEPDQILSAVGKFF